MTRLFRTPWAVDAFATAEQIERHMALALTLDRRDDAHPTELRAALEQAPHHVQITAHRAMNDADELTALMYSNFVEEPLGPECYAPLYQKPSERTWTNFAAFGGRGGTKTRQTGRAVLHQMRTEKNLRVGCVRAILKSISDSVHAQLCEIIRDEGWDNEFSTQNEVIRHTNGSTAVFAGLQNVESLKSTVFDLLWIEEAEECTQQQLDVVIPSVRAKNSAIAFSWNPVGDPALGAQSAVDKMFRPVSGQPPERSVVVHVDAFTNEYFYRTELPSKQRTAFRQDVDNARHVWRGHYRQRMSGLAIKNWKIGAPDLPLETLRLAQNLRGLDFSNGGSDPHGGCRACAIPAPLIYEDYNTREPDPTHKHVLFVVDAFQVPSTSNAGLAKTIRDTIGEPKGDDPEIVGDSANPAMIKALTEEYSIMTVGAEKFPGSVTAGITELNGFDIYVDAKLTELIKQLNGYRWHPEKPDKMIGTRHLIDALRYSIQAFNPTINEGIVWIDARPPIDWSKYETGETFEFDWGFRRGV